MKRKKEEIQISNMKRKEALLLRHPLLKPMNAHRRKKIILGQKSGNNKKITFSSSIIFLRVYGYTITGIYNMLYG